MRLTILTGIAVCLFAISVNGAFAQNISVSDVSNAYSVDMSPRHPFFEQTINVNNGPVQYMPSPFIASGPKENMTFDKLIYVLNHNRAEGDAMLSRHKFYFLRSGADYIGGKSTIWGFNIDPKTRNAQCYLEKQFDDTLRSVTYQTHDRVVVDQMVESAKKHGFKYRTEFEEEGIISYVYTHRTLRVVMRSGIADSGNNVYLLTILESMN